MLAAAPQSPEDVPSRHLVGMDSLFKVCKLPPGKDLKVAEPFVNFQHPQELTRCRWILCSEGRNEGMKEGRKEGMKEGKKEGKKEARERLENDNWMHAKTIVCCTRQISYPTPLAALKRSD